MSLQVNLDVQSKFQREPSNLEAYYRSKIPGIQIRFGGLGYSIFPTDKKRTPYIFIAVDGTGEILGATLVCDKIE